MTWRLTVVCEACHAGWEVTLDLYGQPRIEGVEPLLAPCHECWRPVKIRGAYRILPLHYGKNTIMPRT